MVPVIYSDEFLKHRTGSFHPERPERLTAIVSALKSAPWANQIDWRLPISNKERDLKCLQQIHTPEYIRQVQLLASRGGGRLDPDTLVSSDSYEVALLAVSAWLDGVDYTIATGEPCFVLTRPPGHHALRDQGMGFCLFANAAIAAHYALEQCSLKRVAVLDWDVHHGNGTQALVENNPQIAYCSLHQFPCYPGTGASTERGLHHNVLNLPITPGSTMADYETRFEQDVIPFLNQFQPDLLLVSAGYDGNADDPLASINLQPQDYGAFTSYCMEVTRHVVFGLEGGYDLPTLSQSVVATIEHCL